MIEGKKRRDKKRRDGTSTLSIAYTLASKLFFCHLYRESPIQMIKEHSTNGLYLPRLPNTKNVRRTCLNVSEDPSVNPKP